MEKSRGLAFLTISMTKISVQRIVVQTEREVSRADKIDCGCFSSAMSLYTVKMTLRDDSGCLVGCSTEPLWLWVENQFSSTDEMRQDNLESIQKFVSLHQYVSWHMECNLTERKSFASFQLPHVVSLSLKFSTTFWSTLVRSTSQCRVRTILSPVWQSMNRGVSQSASRGGSASTGNGRTVPSRGMGSIKENIKNPQSSSKQWQI